MIISAFKPPHSIPLLPALTVSHPDRAVVHFPSANLAKSIVGASVVALPHALAVCGWAMGTFMLVLSSIGMSL